MPQFIIQPGYRIHHDGRDYPENTKVEMTEEQAAALLPHGIIAAADAEPKAKGK